MGQVDFCFSVINVQYLVHSVTVPIFIILFFRSIPVMKRWTVSLIGLYLLSFDVIADVLGKHDGTVSVTDKVMALCGFGRIWFTVNWWSESIHSDGTGKYRLLREKHKIWDLMYETFPSIALQVYAGLTTDIPSVTLAASIGFSVLSVSFTIIKHLRNINIFTASTVAGSNALNKSSDPNQAVGS